MASAVLPSTRDRAELRRLLRAIERCSRSPTWRLAECNFEARWTFDVADAQWFVEVFATAFDRGGLVIRIEMFPRSPTATSRAALGRSAWYRSLRAALGVSFREDSARHAPRGGRSVVLAVATNSAGKTAAALRRVSTALGHSALTRRPKVGDAYALIRTSFRGHLEPWTVSGAAFNCGSVRRTLAHLAPFCSRRTQRSGFVTMFWLAHPARNPGLAAAAMRDLESAGYRNPGAHPQLVLSRRFDGLDSRTLGRELARLATYVSARVSSGQAATL